MTWWLKSEYSISENLPKKDKQRIRRLLNWSSIYKRICKSPLSWRELEKITGLRSEELRRILHSLKLGGLVKQNSDKKYIPNDKVSFPDNYFFLDKINRLNKHELNKRNISDMICYGINDSKGNENFLDFCLYGISKKDLTRRQNDLIFRQLVKMSNAKKVIDKLIKKKGKTSFVCSISDMSAWVGI